MVLAKAHLFSNSQLLVSSNMHFPKCVLTVKNIYMFIPKHVAYNVGVVYCNLSPGFLNIVSLTRLTCVTDL